MGTRSTMEIDQLPHAPGRIPILGDVTSVDRSTPTQHELELSKSLGPIFQRKILGDILVVVAGAELATECSDETHWARALVGPGAALRRLAPAGLFTARSSDPLWAQARRILTPSFTQASMRLYHKSMQSVADDLVADWAGRDSVDVHNAMTAATLEVIGRAGFSRRLGLLGAADVDVPDATAFVTALGSILRWASESTNELPLIGTVRNRLREPAVARDTEVLRSYVDAVIADRRASTAEHDDLLAAMLGTVDPDSGERLPDDNIIDQVLTFLVAGHETTAALLESALYYIARDPQLQKTLREEITAAAPLDYSAVAGLRIMRQLINETLRLHPPVPGFFRVARQDQDLGGYRIPAGRAVFVLALAAQRDPDAWGEDAAQFNPSRFGAAQRGAGTGRFFRPWGVGPRSCIGMAFAQHETALLLARILDCFDLTTSTEGLRMVERGTLRPAPYTLTAHNRT
ncbi:cytochrome P450 [Nocardia asteroides]|uniref:cytochrome P450 n=1 Tax=Nocardia asteroides TaxID=1824 RepID=UPI001E59F501|nr:cytochrome P450 [Nocardia asteroides]UGT58908.1 cytochrome P450 [Nocardia asteroides]